MSTAAGAQPTGGSPRSQASHALPAFANVTIDATRSRSSLPGPDPRVAAAFALGWQMAELYRPGRRRRRPAASAEDLPGIGRLGQEEMLRLGVEQLTAGLSALADTIAGAGLDAPNVSALQGRLTHEADEVRQRTVRDLHVEVLLVLTAADFRLGKAYGLGRALADTCRNPADIASMRAELSRFRVATLQQWLDDLGSALPPHAGHSVSSSLARWTDWIQDDAVRSEGETDVVSLLRRQGELWRSLLSGEKLGPDMLEIQNYLDAASGLLRRLRILLLRTVIRFPLIVILVAGLFVGGVWLILAENTAASIAAGLGGIAASLGISWKSLGGSLGKVAARLEQPLWGAELDAAIVDAITLLPGNKRDHRRRGLLAVSAGAGLAESEAGTES